MQGKDFALLIRESRALIQARRIQQVKPRQGNLARCSAGRELQWHSHLLSLLQSGFSRGLPAWVDHLAQFLARRVREELWMRPKKKP
jgi:hypothetical protein